MPAPKALQRALEAAHENTPQCRLSPHLPPLEQGTNIPDRSRAPKGPSADDLDFYGQDHQHRLQEVKMFCGHLFLQVKTGEKIRPAFSL
jgi:hypothetical protein